jgi:hypothetical protein
MSAIVEAGDKAQPIQVLFVLHNGFDTVDLTGPLEILANAAHESSKKKETRAFKVQTAGPNNADYFVTSDQGLKIKVDMDHEDAHDALDEFDILVVCGGNTGPVIDGGLEPISLVKAWAKLQESDHPRNEPFFPSARAPSSSLLPAFSKVSRPPLTQTTIPSSRFCARRCRTRIRALARMCRRNDTLSTMLDSSLERIFSTTRSSILGALMDARSRTLARAVMPSAPLVVGSR